MQDKIYCKGCKKERKAKRIYLQFCNECLLAKEEELKRWVENKKDATL